MGLDSVVSRSFSGQHLYGYTSDRDGRHRHRAGAEMGAAPSASVSGLVVALVYSPSFRATLKRSVPGRALENRADNRHE